MEEDERREREAAANAGHLRTFLAPEIHPHNPMSWVSRMFLICLNLLKYGSVPIRCGVQW